MQVQTNQPYTNRIQIILTPFFGPFVQPGPLGDFDPRRDLEVYVDGVRQVVQTFSYDATNDRYLLFMQNAINTQGIVQVVYHAVSPPFQGRVQAEADATASTGAGAVIPWAALTNYALGQTIVDINGNLQTVVGIIGAEDVGTSGSSVPTWPTTTGATVTDNNIIWATSQPGTASVTGWGAFDKSAQNGEPDPDHVLATSSLAPANTETLALLAASAGGITIDPHWIDMGGPAGIGTNLLQLRSYATVTPISVSESVTTRWASNLLLFRGSGITLTASVTNVQVQSNVLTLAIVAPNYIVGTTLSFSGFSGASFLNNNHAVILTNSGTHITANFTHGNYGPTSDSGTATYCPFLQAVNIDGALDTAGTYMATFPNPVQAGSTILITSITSDNNASAVITAVTDSQSGSYDILYAFSPGGIPANQPGSGIAFAQNVHGGSTTVSVTVSPVHAAPGAISFFALELPKGGAVPFAEIPWTPGVAPSGTVTVNAPPTISTPSIVQTNTVSTASSGGVCHGAFNNPVTAGNVLAVFVYSNSNDTSVTIQDNYFNAYAQEIFNSDSSDAIFAYIAGANSNTTFTVTSVANHSGSQTTYTGTFQNSLNGTATITGFTNSNNNGTFGVVSSTPTTLTVNNSNGVAETHAASAQIPLVVEVDHGSNSRILIGLAELTNTSGVDVTANNKEFSIATVSSGNFTSTALNELALGFFASQAGSPGFTQNDGWIISSSTPGPTPPAPAFVQIVTPPTGPTTGQSATFASNNTAGNFIVVIAEGHSFAGGPGDVQAIITVHDTQGNTYTQIEDGGGVTRYSWFSGNEQGHSTAVFVAANIAAGPNTVTCAITYNNPGAGFLLGSSIRVAEYTGSALYPVIQTAVIAQTGSYTDPTPVTLTTTQPEQLVIFLAEQGIGPTPSGFSTRAGGWFDWVIASPTTQTYALALSTNLGAFAWGLVVTNAPGSTAPSVLVSKVEPTPATDAALVNVDTIIVFDQETQASGVVAPNPATTTITTPFLTPSTNNTWASLFVGASNTNITPNGAWTALGGGLFGFGYQQILTSMTPIQGSLQDSPNTFSGGGADGTPWGQILVLWKLNGNVPPSTTGEGFQISGAGGSGTGNFTNTSPGNTILIIQVSNWLFPTTLTISDSQGNTYQHYHVDPGPGHNGNYQSLDVLIAQNIVGGPNTVTFSNSAFVANWDIAAFELEVGYEFRSAAMVFHGQPHGGTGSYSQTLTISGFDFPTIPSNATVTGLELVITGNQTSAAFSTFLTVSPANPILTSPPVFTTQLPAITGEVVFGSPTTTFGYTLTPAFVNNPANFVFNLQAADTNGNNVTFNFEGATIKVYYYTLQDIVLGATVGGFAEIGNFSTQGDDTLFPPVAALVPSAVSQPIGTPLTLTWNTSGVSYIRIKAADSFDTGLLPVSGGQGTFNISGGNPLLGTAGTITFQMTCYDGNQNPINVNGELSPNVMLAVYLT